ncbi:MAG: PilN domain-containing protein [Desulfobulbaceae bacterium]|nr:PilN domain-containing protein [Desulfobulbaceae bacterium]HIJ78345.1 PilN domain-containing protein [Deltaproteobacteria bacterium]
MRGPEAIITGAGITYCPPTGPGEAIPALLARLGISSAENSATTVYVAEELLFYTTFELPAKTASIKDAVHYQLGMLVPFPEDTYLYSFSSKRRDEAIVVTVYALAKDKIEEPLAEIAANSSTIAGLFPLGQRYLTRSNRKEKWALLLPGPLPKLLIFDHGRTSGRLLCPNDADLTAARELADCQAIYQPAPTPDSGFLDPAPLLAESPLAAEFDLLPAGFRRPDYFKMVITALVGLNLIALLLLIGIKEYSFHRLSNRLDSEIAALQPQIMALNKESGNEVEQRKIIEQMERLGKNPDLIKFFNELSRKLPPSSYLDQIRLDKKSEAIFIHGYSDDISELTNSLQSLGEVRLNSTSRRQNKNYFQLEISLQ